MSEDRKRKRHHEERKDQLGLSTTTSALVDTPAKNDVLFGRGAPIIRWSGNVKFRELIRGRKEEYLATRRHAPKESIAREIIEEIEKRRGGRFLKRAESSISSNDLITGLPRQWILASPSLVMEKVKQALRDRESDDDKKPTKKPKEPESEDNDAIAALPRRNRSGSVQSEIRGLGVASQSRRMSPVVPIAARPVETQGGQGLADLQQCLRRQASDHLDTHLHLGRHNLGGNTMSQALLGQLPGLGIPTSSVGRLPSHDLLLQLSAVGHGRLNIQRLLTQPQLPILYPTVTDPTSTVVAYLQAIQQADAHRQTLVRVLQDTIRLQAAMPSTPRSLAAPSQRDSPSTEQALAAAYNRQEQSKESSSMKEEERNNSDEDGSSMTK